MLKRTFWLVFIVGALSWFAGLHVQAQPTGNRLVLTEIQYQESFPTVSFEVRAYVNGYLAEGLENNLTISEDNGVIGAPIIERLADLPVHLTLFIDNDPYSFSARSSSEINQILSSLNQLGYRDGDTISIFSTGGKYTDYTSWALFNTWLQSGMPVPSGNDLNSQPALTSALRESALRMENGETVGFIYITRVLQEGYDSSAKTTVINGLAAEAQRVGLAVHIIHADSATSGYQEALRALALQTGGRYLPLVSGSTTPQFATQFTPMVDQLFRSRANYRVRYQSTNGTTASRNVTVQAAGQSNSFSYAVALQSPLVTIYTPNDGQVIDRQVTQNTEAGRNEIGMNSANVSFAVTFPDNYPRPLQNVQIIELSPTAQLPIYTLMPGANETIFQTTWDLAEIDAAGDNPRTLRVIVTDNLGLSGQSEVGVTMPIPVAPPAPVPVTEIIVNNICDAAPTSRECIMARVREYTLYLVIVVLVILVFLLRRQIRNSPIGKGIESVIETATAVYGNVRSTIVNWLGSDDNGEAPIYAYLTVTSGQTATVHGQEFADARIPLKQLITAIGRGGKVDISFYSESEKASLSRTHCRIDIDSMQKTVRVRNISNHDFVEVNQQIVRSGEIGLLPNNATLVLGDPDRKGVSFVFTYGPGLMGKTSGKAITQPALTDVSGYGDDDPTKPDRNNIPDAPPPKKPSPKPSSKEKDDDSWMKGLRN